MNYKEKVLKRISHFVTKNMHSNKKSKKSKSRLAKLKSKKRTPIKIDSDSDSDSAKSVHEEPTMVPQPKVIKDEDPKSPRHTQYLGSPYIKKADAQPLHSDIPLTHECVRRYKELPWLRDEGMIITSKGCWLANIDLDHPEQTQYIHKDQNIEKPSVQKGIFLDDIKTLQQEVELAKRIGASYQTTEKQIAHLRERVSEIPDITFYKANEKFYVLQCDINVNRKQSGDLLTFKSRGDVLLSVIVGYETNKGFVIQNNDIYQKELEWFREQRLTRQAKIDKIGQAPITPSDMKFVAQQLSEELQKIAPLSAEYKSDSSFIERAVNEMSSRDNNVQQLLHNLADLVVYLDPTVNTEHIHDKSGKIEKDFNNGFIKRIRYEYYSPEILVTLSPEEKLPIIFGNPKIQQTVKDQVSKTIYYKINKLVYKYLDFLYEKKYPGQRRISKTSYSILADTKVPQYDWRESCSNLEDIQLEEDERGEPYSDAQLLHYSEDGKNYCFVIENMWRQFDKGNYNNPYTNKPLRPEFFDRFKQVYSTRPSAVKDEDKYTPPHAMVPPEQELAIDLIKKVGDFMISCQKYESGSSDEPLMKPKPQVLDSSSEQSSSDYDSGSGSDSGSDPDKPRVETLEQKPIEKCSSCGNSGKNELVNILKDDGTIAQICAKEKCAKGINNYGKTTLPSVEGWGTNINIARDPPKSIMTRRIDKVGETSEITEMIDESADRVCEMISLFPRGINPAVTVSYNNYGNNGGQGIAYKTQARLPYPIMQGGAFRPPQLKQEELASLSRQPRVWTEAYTQPGFADFSKKMSCPRPADKTHEVFTHKLHTSVPGTRKVQYEKPINEPYGTKTHVLEPLSVSGNTNIVSRYDITKQINKIPSSEILKDIVNYSVHSNSGKDTQQGSRENYGDKYTTRIRDVLEGDMRSNVNSAMTFNNKHDLLNKNYTQDIDTINVTSNPSNENISYIQFNDTIDNGNIHVKDSNTVSYTTNSIKQNDGTIVYNNFKDQERNLPLTSCKTNNVAIRETPLENTLKDLDRNVPTYGYHPQATVPRTGTLNSNRNIPITQKICTGSFVDSINLSSNNVNNVTGTRNTFQPISQNPTRTMLNKEIANSINGRFG